MKIPRYEKLMGADVVDAAVFEIIDRGLADLSKDDIKYHSSYYANIITIGRGLKKAWDDDHINMVLDFLQKSIKRLKIKDDEDD